MIHSINSRRTRGLSIAYSLAVLLGTTILGIGVRPLQVFAVEEIKQVSTMGGAASKVRLAQAKRGEGRNEEAISAFNKAQDHLYLGDFETALRFSKQATYLNPKSPRYWNLLGNILLHLTQVESGISALESALDLDRNNREIRRNLECAYWKKR